LLPHDPVNPEGLRPEVRLNTLATLINQLDTAPIGVRPEESPEGRLILLFKQLATPRQDALAFHGGVDRWRWLCSSKALAPMLAVVAEVEQARVTAARLAPFQRLSETVTFVESPCRGFDVWYAERSSVIVAYIATSGTVTLGCQNDATAVRHFGPGGLRAVYSRLQPAGSGGREAVGGSPRGLRLSRDEALRAGELVAKFLDTCTESVVQTREHNQAYGAN